MLWASGPPLAAAAETTPPLTLAAALREARIANAQLPVGNLKLRGALARLEQARGALYPTFALDGDVHAGVPVRYASSDAFVRVLARAPLYEGGELRAARDASEAEAASLRFAYRMAVRDVDYAVRTDYDRVLRAQDDLAFLERGIARLRSYLTVVQSRQASGQGVGADLLRTQQRLAAAEADVAGLTRELHDATMDLNDVLGRVPDRPLDLAPLPEPSAPPAAGDQPWLATPDLGRAQSDIRSAEADVRAVRAGRLPHLEVEADAGDQPAFNAALAPLNNGTGWGAEVTLLFRWPLWDFGIYKGRMAEARAALDQARQQEVVVRRAVRLGFSRAAQALEDLYQEYRARDRATDAARDAYLQAESAYLGGQGTSLEVLDAYDAWIQANQARLDVVYSYRVAEAELYRWGSQ